MESDQPSAGLRLRRRLARLLGLGQAQLAPGETRPVRRPPAQRASYCYLGDHRAVAVTHRGHRIYLDTRDLGLTPHIALDGIWEREVEEVLLRLLRPGQTVAEVGSNMGYHSLAMAQAIGPDGRLHAFEANPDVLPLLRDTIVVNGYQDRIALHPVAALDRAGEIAFASDPAHIGSGHWAAESDAEHYSRRRTVPAVPLDAALADVPALDLLRMDAEGSEPQVLRGAEQLLRRSPGLRIVTEWSPPMMAPRTALPEFIAWLGGHGFVARRIARSGRLEPVAMEALPGLPHGELVLDRQPRG